MSVHQVFFSNHETVLEKRVQKHIDGSYFSNDVLVIYVVGANYMYLEAVDIRNKYR